MYDYGSLVNVPIVDELNEGLHEENILNNYELQSQQHQRTDGFTSLTNYVDYRMNNMESQISNLTAMVSELLEKTRGI